MAIDIHQHLWSESVLGELARRRRAPRVRRHDGRWLLEIPGEPPSPVDIAGDDVVRRAELVHLDGMNRALVALSSALSVECLPPDEALALLNPSHEALAALPREFGAWASVPLRDAELCATVLSEALDRAFCGLVLPAGAARTRAGLERCAPLLALLERRDVPLFVHPGPDPWQPAAGATDDPPWWTAMTAYIDAMAAAWHAFVAFGRPLYPLLRMVFALLAGGAPLHIERLAARGGPVAGAHDLRLFYDTSSYGVQAIDAMIRIVGIDQLVHGSDRTMVAPLLGPGAVGGAAWRALTCTNPARLLGAVG
jgi:hypothetical protein